MGAPHLLLLAAFVAASARAGELASAWRFMLEHYQETDWELPSRCRITPPPNGACPEEQRIRPDGYPQALGWFLADTGYITGQDLEALPLRRPQA